MPLYDYKCDCGKEFEVQQSITAEKYKDCSEVGYFDCDKPNKLKRLIGKPAIDVFQLALQNDDATVRFEF